MNASELRNLAIERYGAHGSRPVLKHLQDHLADFDLAMARHPVSRHFYFGTRQAVTRLTGVTFGTGAVQRHLSLVTPSPLATIIFEFLYCASAQGEDSKEKKGCGEKEGRKKNPLGEF